MNPSDLVVEVVGAKDLQRNSSDTATVQNEQAIAPPQKQAASEKNFFCEYFDEEILNVIIDCHKDNWDGYGSKKYSEKSTAKARLFCSALSLPERLSTPYISIDPDGYVMFTWRNKSDIFSIIIQPNDTIVYSWIMGINTSYGTLNVDFDNPPAELLQKLNSFAHS